MSAREQYGPAELPITEEMEVYCPPKAGVVKRVLIRVAGGNDSFFPEEEPDEQNIIDWAQWEETATMRAEWAERASVQSLSSDHWFNRMEFGHEPEDVAIPTSAQPVETVIDIPSFIRQPRSYRVTPRPPKPKARAPDGAPVIDLAVKRTEHDATLPEGRLGISRRAALVVASRVAFNEPEPTFLDVFESKRRQQIEEQTPEPCQAEKEQSPESPERVEFVLGMTRGEIIATLAERLATPKARLPHHLGIKAALYKDSAHRSLLDDEDFIGLLRGYGAGRERFVAAVFENRKHPEYQSIVLQSPSRTAYLSEYNAADLLVISSNPETPA